jgi:nucleotide-binding universal stress UspA family protein
MTLTNILVPVDFSPNATLALEQAVDLATTYQAQLTVVYIIPQVIFHPDWAADVEETLDVADITAEAQQTLDKMTAPYRQAGVCISIQVLAGGPYVEIVRLARQIGANLIVIGAHGTTDRQPFLMGSVAEKVVRDAPCSVLTVRALHQATPVCPAGAAGSHQQHRLDSGRKRHG